ncbi:MAG: thiamine-phosphate kinase [Vampirovibrionales bacterium]|nr:thiamine-phosphate kinase [Vampirovibrionales bacterium]
MSQSGVKHLPEERPEKKHRNDQENTLNEAAILERIAGLLSHQAIGLTGHLDDDAYFCPQRRLILTTDMLVEGTHFRFSTHSPYDIGWKAAAVNISDIAAMGGKPDFLLISIGLTKATSTGFIDGLYEGLSHCAKAYQALIVGGDTVFSPQLTINVTAVGQLPLQHTLGTRSGARPGHRLIVTGPHGLSAAGLYALDHGIKNAPELLLQTHRRPTPRIEQALTLSKRITHYAMMDTSDGLADACLKLSKQSKVQIILDESKLPVNPDLAHFAEKQKQDLMQWMLYGGEDFELIATMPVELPLPAGWQEIGRVHELPAIEPAPNGAHPNYDNPTTSPVVLHRLDGSLMPLGLDKTFSHFG